MRIDGQVALITGASRGIGRAIAELFAEKGATVLLNSRHENALRETAKQIVQKGWSEPLIMPYDVADQLEIKKAFQAIHKQFGKLDILVNNAGMLGDGLVGMLQPALIEQVMAVNVNAVLFHMQYGSRLMIRQKRGSIINVSSIMGIEGAVGQTLYSASKAAVIGATKSAAKELAAANIRVNALAPGFIETDMTDGIPEDKYNERVSSIRMKRVGLPEEVANGALFLASDMSSYVTGQVLGIDGGMSVD